MSTALGCGLGVLGCLVPLLPAQQEPPQTTRTGISSATQPVSPVAVATWLTRDGNRSELDLVVIWRGTPGWFLVSEHGGSGGGRAGAFQTTIKYGDVFLQLSLISNPRVVSIQGKSLPIPDKNVVLVDHADSPTGLEIAGTLSIDPSFPGPARLGPVLARSPEIVAFLRCDVRLEGSVDVVLQKLCADIIGREASRSEHRRP